MPCEVILVVDDEPAIRTLIKVALESAGYVALTAGGPQEALDTLRETAVDLLLTDMIMPDMSGAELIEHVKASWPETVVCAMSAYVDYLPADTFFLQKPFSTPMLIDTIRTALKGHREPAPS